MFPRQTVSSESQNWWADFGLVGANAQACSTLSNAVEDLRDVTVSTCYLVSSTVSKLTVTNVVMDTMRFDSGCPDNTVIVFDDVTLTRLEINSVGSGTSLVLNDLKTAGTGSGNGFLRVDGGAIDVTVSNTTLSFFEPWFKNMFSFSVAAGSNFTVGDSALTISRPKPGASSSFIAYASRTDRMDFHFRRSAFTVLNSVNVAHVGLVDSVGDKAISVRDCRMTFVSNAAQKKDVYVFRRSTDVMTFFNVTIQRTNITARAAVASIFRGAQKTPPGVVSRGTESLSISDSKIELHSSAPSVSISAISLMYCGKSHCSLSLARSSVKATSTLDFNVVNGLLSGLVAFDIEDVAFDLEVHKRVFIGSLGFNFAPTLPERRSLRMNRCTFKLKSTTTFVFMSGVGASAVFKRYDMVLTNTDVDQDAAVVDAGESESGILIAPTNQAVAGCTLLVENVTLNLAATKGIPSGLVCGDLADTQITVRNSTLMFQSSSTSISLEGALVKASSVTNLEIDVSNSTVSVLLNGGTYANVIAVTTGDATALNVVLRDVTIALRLSTITTSSNYQASMGIARAGAGLIDSALNLSNVDVSIESTTSAHGDTMAAWLRVPASGYGRNVTVDVASSHATVAIKTGHVFGLTLSTTQGLAVSIRDSSLKITRTAHSSNIKLIALYPTAHLANMGPFEAPRIELKNVKLTGSPHQGAALFAHMNAPMNLLDLTLTKCTYDLATYTNGGSPAIGVSGFVSFSSQLTNTRIDVTDNVFTERGATGTVNLETFFVATSSVAANVSITIARNEITMVQAVQGISVAYIAGVKDAASVALVVENNTATIEKQGATAGPVAFARLVSLASSTSEWDLRVVGNTANVLNDRGDVHFVDFQMQSNFVTANSTLLIQSNTAKMTPRETGTAGESGFVVRPAFARGATPETIQVLDNTVTWDLLVYTGSSRRVSGLYTSRTSQVNVLCGQCRALLRGNTVSVADSSLPLFIVQESITSGGRLDVDGLTVTAGVDVHSAGVFWLHGEMVTSIRKVKVTVTAKSVPTIYLLNDATAQRKLVMDVRDVDFTATADEITGTSRMIFLQSATEGSIVDLRRVRANYTVGTAGQLNSAFLQLRVNSTATTNPTLRIAHCDLRFAVETGTHHLRGLHVEADVALTIKLENTTMVLNHSQGSSVHIIDVDGDASAGAQLSVTDSKLYLRSGGTRAFGAVAFEADRGSVDFSRNTVHLVSPLLIGVGCISVGQAAVPITATDNTVMVDAGWNASVSSSTTPWIAALMSLRSDHSARIDAVGNAVGMRFTGALSSLSVSVFRITGVPNGVSHSFGARTVPWRDFDGQLAPGYDPTEPDIDLPPSSYPFQAVLINRTVNATLEFTAGGRLSVRNVDGNVAAMAIGEISAGAACDLTVRDIVGPSLMQGSVRISLIEVNKTSAPYSATLRNITQLTLRSAGHGAAVFQAAGTPTRITFLTDSVDLDIATSATSNSVSLFRHNDPGVASGTMNMTLVDTRVKVVNKEQSAELHRASMAELFVAARNLTSVVESLRAASAIEVASTGTVVRSVVIEDSAMTQTAGGASEASMLRCKAIGCFLIIRRSAVVSQNATWSSVVRSGTGGGPSSYFDGSTVILDNVDVTLSGAMATVLRLVGDPTVVGLTFAVAGGSVRATATAETAADGVTKDGYGAFGVMLPALRNSTVSINGTQWDITGAACDDGSITGQHTTAPAVHNATGVVFRGAFVGSSFLFTHSAMNVSTTCGRPGGMLFGGTVTGAPLDVFLSNLTVVGRRVHSFAGQRDVAVFLSPVEVSVGVLYILNCSVRFDIEPAPGAQIAVAAVVAIDGAVSVTQTDLKMNAVGVADVGVCNVANGRGVWALQNRIKVRAAGSDKVSIVALQGNHYGTDNVRAESNTLKVLAPNATVVFTTMVGMKGGPLRINVVANDLQLRGVAGVTVFNHERGDRPSLPPLYVLYNVVSIDHGTAAVIPQAFISIKLADWVDATVTKNHVTGRFSSLFKLWSLSQPVLASVTAERNTFSTSIVDSFKTVAQVSSGTTMNATLVCNTVGGTEANTVDPGVVAEITACTKTPTIVVKIPTDSISTSIATVSASATVSGSQTPSMSLLRSATASTTHTSTSAVSMSLTASSSVSFVPPPTVTAKASRTTTLALTKTGGSVSQTAQIIPETLPPKPPVVKVARDTATAAVAVSGLVSPATAVQAARSNMLVSLQDCSPDLDEPLEFIDSPTGVAISSDPTRYYLGASVMNRVVMLGAFVLALIPGAIYAAWHRSKGHDFKVMDILAWIRMPSFQTFVVLFVLQPTVTSSVAVIRFAESGGVRTAGIFLLLLDVVTIVLMCAPVLQRPFKAQFFPINFFAPKPKKDEDGVVKRQPMWLMWFQHIVLDRGDWKDASTGSNYCRYFGAFFDEYNGPNHWFLICEVLFSAGLGALAPLAIGHACFPISICVVGLFLIYLAALIWRRPHAAILNFCFALTMASLQAIAAVCVIIVTIIDDTNHPLLRPVINGVSTSALFLSFLKMVYDLIHSGYRVVWKYGIKNLSGAVQTRIFALPVEADKQLEQLAENRDDQDDAAREMLDETFATKELEEPLVTGDLEDMFGSFNDLPAMMNEAGAAINDDDIEEKSYNDGSTVDVELDWVGLTDVPAAPVPRAPLPPKVFETYDVGSGGEVDARHMSDSTPVQEDAPSSSEEEVEEKKPRASAFDALKVFELDQESLAEREARRQRLLSSAEDMMGVASIRNMLARTRGRREDGSMIKADPVDIPAHVQDAPPLPKAEGDAPAPPADSALTFGNGGADFSSEEDEGNTAGGDDFSTPPPQGTAASSPPKKSGGPKKASGEEINPLLDNLLKDLAGTFKGSSKTTARGSVSEQAAAAKAAGAPAAPAPVTAAKVTRDALQPTGAAGEDFMLAALLNPEEHGIPAPKSVGDFDLL